MRKLICIGMLLAMAAVACAAMEAFSPLDGLATLRKLTSLDLSYNPITNYAAVAALTNLQSLYLQGTSIRDLAPVYELFQACFGVS